MEIERARRGGQANPKDQCYSAIRKSRLIHKKSTNICSPCQLACSVFPGLFAPRIVLYGFCVIRHSLCIFRIARIVFSGTGVNITAMVPLCLIQKSIWLAWKVLFKIVDATDGKISAAVHEHSKNNRGAGITLPALIPVSVVVHIRDGGHQAVTLSYSEIFCSSCCPAGICGGG